MYSPFRWYVMFVMFIVTASTSLILIAPVTIIDSISHTSGISPPTIITLTMSTFNFFIVVAVMLGGMLVDKFGVNKVYIFCLIMIILGNVIVVFFGNSIIGLFIGRTIQGLGTGPIMVSIAVLARQWFKVHEQGIVTGIQGMAVSMGIAVGFLLVPRLVEHFVENWTQVFIFISGINLVGIILTAIVVLGPKSHPIENHTKLGEENQVKFKIIQPLVILGAICMFGSTWLQQSVNAIGASFIGIELGMGQIKGANLMFYYSLAFAIGSPLSGVIAGIWLKGKRDHQVIGFAFLVSVVFSLIIINFTSLNSLIICLIVLGIFQAFISPIVMSFIAKTYPQNMIGKVSGFTMTFSFIAGIFAPYICSLTLDLTDTYSYSFLVMTGVAFFSLFFALRLKK